MKFRSQSQLTVFLLVFFAVVGLYLSTGPVAHNLTLVSLLLASPSLSSLNPYWYGAGLRFVSEEQARSLVLTHMDASASTNCDLWERQVLQQSISSIQKITHIDSSNFIDILMAARQSECAGDTLRADQELTYLADDRIQDIWQLGLLSRSGQQQEAFRKAMHYLCPDSAGWCVDYFGSLWLPGTVFSDVVPKNVELIVAGSVEESSRSITNSINIGKTPSPSNLNLDSIVPLVVSGVTKSGDNYLEYPSRFSSGAVLKYRIRGEVVGGSGVSCIRPRLGLYASNTYIGEPAPIFEVSDKFEIEYWINIPSGVTEVIPRISFQSSCFSENQKIAIYEVEMGFGP